MDNLPRSYLDEISSALEVSHLEASGPFHGCSHDIFVLTLPSKERWTLRIAKDEFAASLASRSIAIMRHILKAQPTLPIPQVIFKAQGFTVLEYIDGNPIGSWNSLGMTEQTRHKLLRGLATFLYKLWTCPAPAAETCKARCLDYIYCC